MRRLGTGTWLALVCLLILLSVLGWLMPSIVQGQGGGLANLLLFPFYQSDADTFTGYAVTNFSDQTAQLEVEGRSRQGDLLAFASNPRMLEIIRQAQTAQLGRELFGDPGLLETRTGWLRMSSDTADLAGFFLFGNGLSGPQTQLDGSLALTGQSQVLLFSRLFDGPSTFRVFGLEGFQDAETFLSIANPNNETLTLAMKLFLNTGQVLAQTTRTLGPQATLFGTVRSIFDSLQTSTQIRDGHVRVDVTGSGAVGFALIQLEDSIMGLNASFGTGSNRLYSAQLASGTDAAGNSIFTSLKLVNTTSSLRSVTIKGFRDNGSEIRTVAPFTLNQNSSFQFTISEIFSLGSPTLAQLTTGSLRIDVDGGGGVIGDIIFGDPGDVDTGTPNLVDFAAAVPLQTTLFTRAVFSHVANGSVVSGERSLDIFTGIALFNPNSGSALITLQVFDPDGLLVGTAQVSLGPNQRTSRVITELIPQAAGLLGGYVVVESTLPLVAQQLFGNAAQQFLAAIPPRIIQ